MSHYERTSTRHSSTGTGLHAQVNPNPFQAAEGYQITVTGGVPPYTFEAKDSPPNPPGVHVTHEGGMAHVTVPADTPPGTKVYVDVKETGTSPQTANTVNTVA